MGKGSLAVVGFLLLPKNLTLILLTPPLNSCLPETKCAQKAPLLSTVHSSQKRLGKLPDDQILSDYLSGDVGGDFSTTSNKFSNT
ncbi:hypothetical protein CDAR_493201 [Caerostris darwini]|uniref:Uncharacterized protein n=1 Tax=Caerostris darwini TaxID=1538125 RepID=A0AAV4TSR5_9ARAC|nr:hypothetical protein CDAR_493201 [Caerostris darwini]